MKRFDLTAAEDGSIRLSELFAQAPGFMALLCGPDHRIDLANPGYIQLVGHREVLGRTVAEALPDAVEQGYLTLLNDVFNSGLPYSAFGALYAVQTTPGGEVNNRYVDFVFQPIRDENGEVSGIFVQGTDVTQRVKIEQRRDALIRLSDNFRSAATMADLSFAAGAVLGETLGHATRVGFGTINARDDTLHVERDWTARDVESLHGVTPLRDYGSFIDSLKAGQFISIGDVRLDVRTAAAAAALEGRHARSFVNVPVLEEGRLVAVLFVNSDRARTWTEGELGFIKEVAERTRTSVERTRNAAALLESERHLKLMVLELNHRVKNSLATVQGIAAQTLRNESPGPVEREAFMERISALAVAHDILTQEQWDGLNVREIARGVLGALQGAGTRIVLSGPDLLLTPKAGLALAMAFHELGTNALKYGALSVPTGEIALTWFAPSADRENLTVEWSERGGPAVVPPNRRGFGSRLLERGLAAEINGQVEMSFPPTGVRCVITGKMRLTAEGC
jgi:two-component sensor histidine kinase